MYIKLYCNACIALFVGRNRQSNLLPWIIIGFFFILLIGLCYKVGGNFGTYVKYYEGTIGISLALALKMGSDTGHQFLNWLTEKWDLGVYGINTIYATIIMIVLGYAAVLFVWLNFSIHAPIAWIPYQNILFVDLF